MKIALGSDHAGYAYKEKIKAMLLRERHDVKDCGTFSSDMVDYPVYVRPAAEAVARGECERGIVLGGSGNGEAMVANKVKGVRCALCWNEATAKACREHNDANVLSLGERMTTVEMALAIVRIFLETPFDPAAGGGRHARRIAMIE